MSVVGWPRGVTAWHRVTDKKQGKAREEPGGESRWGGILGSKPKYICRLQGAPWEVEAVLPLYIRGSFMTSLVSRGSHSHLGHWAAPIWPRSWSHMKRPHGGDIISSHCWAPGSSWQQQMRVVSSGEARCFLSLLLSLSLKAGWVPCCVLHEFLCQGTFKLNKVIPPVNL